MENRIGHSDMVALELYGVRYSDLSDRECAIVARIIERGGIDDIKGTYDKVSHEE
jgi:hypothetical protein